MSEPFGTGNTAGWIKVGLGVNGAPIYRDAQGRTQTTLPGQQSLPLVAGLNGAFDTGITSSSTADLVSANAYDSGGWTPIQAQEFGAAGGMFDSQGNAFGAKVPESSGGGFGAGLEKYGGLALGAAGLGANIYFANKNAKLLKSQDKWNRDRTTIADNNTKSFADRVGGTYSTTV